ncbi:HD-GYP domain-containing protein [Marinobacter sp.]|uniref:HD-GYP domain-containing protein n=1 Tax=Marinobacter sp. TaxID=50741 RepID=UPI003563D5D5
MKPRDNPDTPLKGDNRGSQAETHLSRARIPVDLLQLGMRIVMLDRPWTDVPVLFQDFTLSTAEEARVLRQYCSWVVVEDTEERLTPVLAHIPLLKQKTALPLSETKTIEQELPRAKKTWSRTLTFVDRLTTNIIKNNALELDEARTLIKSCVDSVKANASAMLWMARIKNRDTYTAEHCLRVAVYAITFARFLGMPDEDLETAGMCGLLHDLGKLKIPGNILNKPGRLTPEEFAIMREHTTHGYNLLKQDKNLTEIVRDVTLHHHERIDGKGYPSGLPENQISRFARLISIVDTYDAITSDRCYKNGNSPSDAVRILFQCRGTQFDTDMVEAFIRMIGLYPPGSLVELNTGEIALVISSHPGRKLKPRVEIILDANKHPITPYILDLATETTEDALHREINSPLPDGAYGIELKDRVQQLSNDRKNSAVNL